MSDYLTGRNMTSPPRSSKVRLGRERSGYLTAGLNLTSPLRLDLVKIGRVM